MIQEDLNLDRMYKATIERAYRTYPYLTDVEIARLLGISDRNLYRFVNRFNIDKKKLQGKVNKATAEAIGRLTVMGYKITKTI